MKKQSVTIILVLAAIIMSAFVPLDQVDSGNPADPEELTEGIPVSASVSEQEAAGLLYMREEEKLAHDLYAAFYTIYGLQAFENIAASEFSHTESVKLLLERYGVFDPSAGNAEGVFVNLQLQDLYNRLLEQGSQSLADAIKVGAAVEEIDILDLQSRMAQTSLTDILQVYKNLELGSSNHLRAFVSLLETQTGEVYAPIHLPANEFQSIISGSTGKNNPGRQNARGQNGQRGQ